MAGNECEWRRLLGYHAFGTGLSPATVSQPLATGVYTHGALEALLKSTAVTKEEVQQVIEPVLAAYREYAKGTELPIDEQCALIEGLTHAYARIVLPWLRENFDILSSEEEGILGLDKLEWMFRPDFVTRHKGTGVIAAHDFKTSSSWSEARDVGEYQDSVQMMMNAHGVAKQLAEPVPYYYIHVLLKGNDYAQSPLIYPYFRMGNPPIQPHDYKAYYKFQRADGSTGYLGRTYSRTPIWVSRPVRDWVWEMDAVDCAKSIILIGPYGVNERKVERFITGMEGYEENWKHRLVGVDWDQWANPGFQQQLDRTFHRTYKCYTYGSRCAFYRLCHQHSGWEDPLQNGYETRTPHHTTEEI